MPIALLQAFWKIYEPIAAILAPVLLAVLIGLWIADRTHIAALDHDNASLRAQIDDPNTGFRAQLSRSQANAAQLRANASDLQAALDKQNAAIAALQAAANSASERANAAQAAAADDLATANSLSQKLAAQKPQTASYSALVDLLKGAAP